MTPDNENPFFQPLWRRIAIVAVCFGWAIFEFSTNVPFWGTIALGFGAYGIWQFFIAWKPRADNAAPNDPGKE